MKKTYIIPCLNLMEAHAEQILAASFGVIGNGNDINIGYGGVDNAGEVDPDAKESNWSIWE